MSGEKRGRRRLEGEALHQNINQKIDKIFNETNDDKKSQLINNFNTFLKQHGFKFDKNTSQVKKIVGGEVVYDYRKDLKTLEEVQKLPKELIEESLEYASPSIKTEEEKKETQEKIKKIKQENIRKAREAKARYKQEKEKQAEEQQKQQQTETKTATKEETKTETKKQKKERLKLEETKDKADLEGFKVQTQIAFKEADEQAKEQEEAKKRAEERREAFFKKQLNESIKNYAKNKNEKDKQKILFYNQIPGEKKAYAKIKLDDEGNIISIIDPISKKDLYKEAENTQQLIRQITQPQREEKQQLELMDSQIRIPPNFINTNGNIPGILDQLEINETNEKQTNINAKSYNETLSDLYDKQQKKYISVDAAFKNMINTESKEEKEISFNLGIPDQTSNTQQQEEENLKQRSMEIVSEEIKNPMVSSIINDMIDRAPGLSEYIISTVEGKIYENYEEELKPAYEINEPKGHLKDKLNTLQEAGGNRQDVELKRNYYDNLEDEGDYLNDYDYEDFEDYDYEEIIPYGQNNIMDRFRSDFSGEIRTIGDTLSDLSGFEIPDSISQVGSQIGSQVGRQLGGQLIDMGIGEITRRIRGKKEPTEELTEEELLLDQIKRINENLDRGGSYAEQKPIKRYRFPEPYENYNAVQLVQNSVTGYLNDYNLYGNIQGFNMDEI